jgi:hypothetical protein
MVKFISQIRPSSSFSATGRPIWQALSSLHFYGLLQKKTDEYRQKCINIHIKPRTIILN